MDHLPDITNIARFCHCLRLEKGLCDKIEKEAQGNLWKQTRDIAAVWLDRHTKEPHWLEIIRTLICMRKCYDAKKIADKTGVEIPDDCKD